MLDKTGKPFSSILQIAYDCNSESIVESKSLKLYLNSFNQTLGDPEEALDTISRDLNEVLKTDQISVKFKTSIPERILREAYCVDFCLDSRQGYVYSYDPTQLKREGLSQNVWLESHRLYSNLLKSNCRHTHQPDWGTVFVEYRPNQYLLNETSFLRYIISFRKHSEFHEECCERITSDLYNLLDPCWLKVECKYTRRGGIDINPQRSVGGAYFGSFDEIVDKFEKTPRQ